MALPGVDDSYPPQKKSFMMLKYMHDHFIDKFEWFVRADDDVFIKGDRLDEFLRSINSSQPRFIGQAGVGKAEELGLLSLQATENFCMGGPGMILSRETLLRVAPHVGYCLQNLYTTHEDVEIGRCVRQFAGIQCTWAYEMQQILYQNYKEDQGSFKRTLKSKEVERAVTLHPVKDPDYQYRIFNYLRSVNILKHRQRQVQLLREIYLVDQQLGHRTLEGGEAQRLGFTPGLNRFVPHEGDDVVPWEFFNKPVFSQFNNNPKRGMDASLSGSLDDAVMQVMDLVNRNARVRGRTIDFKEILYGYRRVNPLVGTDYILDLLLIYRKHKGRKMTVQVRRHAYLQQSFMQVDLMEENPIFRPKASMGEHVLNLFQKVAGRQSWVGVEEDKHKETIHFIMPLAGRFKIFQRFMLNFEDVCLRRREAVRLIVVMYVNLQEEDAYSRSVDLLQRYQRHYGSDRIEIIHAQGAFSRGRGLELGGQRCHSGALLFMVDVDILMTAESLMRIRLNTVLGRQVYFPIVFSQYDPRPVCKVLPQHCQCPAVHGLTATDDCMIIATDFSEPAGYWRQFGFGIATMYRADMLSVGGFDLSIQGWGKEDVDLYTKFIESNLTVFRAVDPGMTHIFHTIACDPSLDAAQLTMCVNSKAQSYAAVPLLANEAYSYPDLMRRHEKHALNMGR